jgi:hypothetical protein
MFYDNKTHRLQTYVLMSWIRIDFYGLRLRSWSFLCVTFHASLFVHALWVFTSKNSQTSLVIHPKPKTSFCDHLLVQNPIWVWSKILDGDSNIPHDYGIYTYFSSHFPSLLCSRSIIQAWGRRHYIISDKCYVSIMLQKVLRSKRKKWKMKKLWWEEKWSKEIGRINKERKREKWEGNKIKVKNIIKVLIGSFCFISSQVPWWQIHTQIFQPCAIR